MYEIMLNMDADTLQQLYPGAEDSTAYNEIREVLASFGFAWYHGGLYVGSGDKTAVDCILAVQRVQRLHPWFSPAVRDLRMLRIEESADLRPAL